jgi:DNA-binding beta-propeller fold protein YncE
MALGTRTGLCSGLALAMFVGCGSDPVNPDPVDAPDPPPAEVIGALGSGDGSPGSVTFVTVFDPEDNRGIVLEPTSMAWSGVTPGELWVTLRESYVDEPCNDGDACAWLEGYVAVISGADAEPSVSVKKDINAWHFMRRPTGIAWGVGDYFATAGEARTANYEDAEAAFNGPVLWTADPAIFAIAEGLPTHSSHIDMLHESPYAMGIAHAVDNEYWVMNGDAGSLDRYDFNVPHEPGADDHSDGEVWRYAAGELLRVPEVPSHLVFEDTKTILYAADTGHQRVIALDTTTGRPDGDIFTYDPIDTHVLMTGASVQEVVSPGTMELPSGIDYEQGALFVADRASGRIMVFDAATGRQLRSLDTGLGAGALTAVSFGPDGKIYFTDVLGGRVIRVEP